ncbi:MAG: TauD/TfdA family dioxygenase [Acidimicrobiales bacterium]|nr:TauD/TfdA family dioxygenase [Acidimicrobiales bacterium]MCB9394146.1 TauD/TfdA family dioxygenase [Acidimicrobiaceae bacterium]
MDGVRFSIDPAGATPVLLVTVDGVTQPVPPLWLREQSRDPSQLDLVSDQRLFDPHRLPVDLTIVDATVDGASVWARFGDGHAERFDTTDLVLAIRPDDGLPDPVAWRAELRTPPRHDWRSMHEPAALEAALHDFLTHGTIVVHDTPTAEGTVLDVASAFGHVRETNFGRLFDVRSVPRANDLAYSPVPLGPHTDNPYRVPTPGIQLLHCLVNETSGGLSTLVDAIAVTDQLRAEDPEGFDLLVDTVVRFHFRDDDTALDSYRPIVDVDHRRRVTGLHYSPRLDHLPLMSDDRTRAYHRARHRLAQLLNDPAFEIRFLLEPGEAMVFSNDRVLHGRTGFDPQEGRRHLQGCYIDHDAPRSRYRVLRRRLVRPFASLGADTGEG